jgi:polar amino acid transport system substrate-binding protein
MRRLVRRVVVLLAGWLCLSPMNGAALAQDTLSAIRDRGVLVWGADREGGGPFVYPREDDPEQIQGFEVEIAEYLAGKLGVRAEFAQGQWDKLPDMLDRGDLDIVLNGYEWTPARAEYFGTSVPYYIYELQLLGRKGDSTLTSWQDVAVPPAGTKKRICVLGASAAEDYLRENYPDTVEIVTFDGATDAMRAVELAVDGLDANLQDGPVTVFYRNDYPLLTHVGEPVGRGYYVVLVRKGDDELLAAINEAIIAGLRDGSLRKILEEYGLWNETQSRRALETTETGGFVGDLIADGETGAEGEESTAAPHVRTVQRGWEVIRSRGPILLAATKVTLLLAVMSMPLAILWGLLIALGRLYGPAVLRWPLTAYVELVRGTPLVLQLYVIYFLLPEIGVSIPRFWSGVLGLAINYSAYEAEIYRAGLQAIPRGQMEAALALGMSRWLAVRRIIIPQATRIVIPAVTNDFIALFKDTAVCSVISVIELSKAYSIHAQSTRAIVELGILTCILYFALSYPLSLVAGMLERRLSPNRRV